MYLLTYNELGVLDTITPNAPFGLVGAYLDKLPMSIDDLLLNDIVEKLETTEHKIYYKIKGE